MTTVGKLLGAVRWYVREVTGEADYDRYCERHRHHHPHVPLPTRREFQRIHTARRELDRPSRCC
ncbi:YbdD/YjiX family protein [Streptomyces sp. NPDC018833]|uniref:YbdD/YjiX family protein n=1 Tax=Streptomyces sp. NPDC018833 TaxID=3365053 RepID=UPI0037990963